MKNIYIIIATILIGGFTSCVDLDIPPKTIIGNEDLYNEEGIQAYMAGMYRMLPMDDFKVNGANQGHSGYFGWNCGVWPMVSTGEACSRDQWGMGLHAGGYWTEAWKIIRNANRMIENLPAYVNEIPEAQEWIAESYFVRAYVYFTMAKRYGGLPILDKMMEYDPDFSKLERARSSCEDTYNFILSDLDQAIAGMPPTSAAGRANKFVAAALKSRVALFAATIAKYGGDYLYMSKRETTLMLCGIPADKATGYFKQAWDAADVVMKSNKYELNGGNAVSATDKQKAFEEVFSNAQTSKESIFIRKYDFDTYVHSFDAIMSPERIRNNYGNRFGVTLDWIELFDGKSANGNDFVNPATGKINVMNEDGTYIVFDNPGALYENVEPRLKASIFVPMQTYKGIMTFDIRAGVIKEEIDPDGDGRNIQKFSLDDYKTASGYDGNIYSFYKDKILRNTGDPRNQSDPVTLANGDKVYRNGIDGPSGANIWSTATGIHGRKWINLNMPKAETDLHRSTQPWIDIRYAEVLLNRAEAALELYQSGTTSYQGIDMRDDAFAQINAIRSRGGADLLANANELSMDPAYDRTDNPGKGGFIVAPNRGLQIVRVERYKELAFEHKLYWDLRRWFTFHLQINNYYKRKLNPFMFLNGATPIVDNGYTIATGKLIYDARICEPGSGNGGLTYDGLNNYYEKIPDGELRKSDLLEGNRNQ